MVKPCSQGWSCRDKRLFFLVLIPFAAAFVGSLVLIGVIHPLLAVVLVLLYVVGNGFQARCCVGCPYRGGFCPPIFGVYLANIFSMWWYAEEEHDPEKFTRSANIAMTFLGAALLYALYWLATLSWWYVLGFLVLMVAHVLLMFWLICPKCGYNDTCPAGILSCSMFGKKSSQEGGG